MNASNYFNVYDVNVVVFYSCIIAWTDHLFAGILHQLGSDHTLLTLHKTVKRIGVQQMCTDTGFANC